MDSLGQRIISVRIHMTRYKKWNFFYLRCDPLKPCRWGLLALASDKSEFDIIPHIDFHSDNASARKLSRAERMVIVPTSHHAGHVSLNRDFAAQTTPPTLEDTAAARALFKAERVVTEGRPE